MIRKRKSKLRAFMEWLFPDFFYGRPRWRFSCRNFQGKEEVHYFDKERNAEFWWNATLGLATRFSSPSVYPPIRLERFVPGPDKHWEVMREINMPQEDYLNWLEQKRKLEWAQRKGAC